MCRLLPRHSALVCPLSEYAVTPCGEAERRTFGVGPGWLLSRVENEPRMLPPAMRSPSGASVGAGEGVGAAPRLGTSRDETAFSLDASDILQPSPSTPGSVVRPANRRTPGRCCTRLELIFPPASATCASAVDRSPWPTAPG